MDFKYKKTISTMLISGIFLGSFFPTYVQAQGLPTTDVPRLIKQIVDGVAMVMAQMMVDQMVKSTITWANSGFEKTPAFVTDPKEYFTGIANSAAGKYIEGTKLNGLCSPFQANIRISLAKSYSNSNSLSRCTLTGVVGNIDKFYNSFSEGGWGGWISMTQSDTNNPLGAYLGAQIQLDKNLRSVLGVEKEKLSWGQGFKSKGDCLEYNSYENASTPEQTIEVPDGKFRMDPATGKLVPSGGTTKQKVPATNTRILKDSTKGEGACISNGPDKTPGTIIAGQLNAVLPSKMKGLVSAQNIEQLISAFASGILQRFVFGPKGLIGNDYKDTYKESNIVGSSPNAQPPVECSVDRELVTAGESGVTWSLKKLPPNITKIEWSGSELDGATTTFASVVYQTPSLPGEPKTAKVKLTVEDTQGNPKTYGPVACAGAVHVSRYQPLAVSCYPSILLVKYRTPVSWVATISGGSGKFKLIQWGGQQESVPKTNNKMLPVSGQNPNVPKIEWRYSESDGINFGAVFTFSPIPIVQFASIYNTLNRNAASGLTTQELFKDEEGLFTSVLTRVYLRTGSPLDSVNAWITVMDDDPTVPPVSKIACTRDITIDPTDN